MTELKHIPVMLNECMEGLNLKDGGIYFDGTLGGAGHSESILKGSSPNGYLVATDLDDYALDRANKRLSRYGNRFTLLKDNFKNFLKIKEDLNIKGFDGILLDLGVSSFQLDDKSRGFSYMAEDEFLDMRMDRSNSLTAEKILNTYTESELRKIFFEYGEERFAGKIARNIVETRRSKPIKTIRELNEIIDRSIPVKFKTKGHPSKKTFQALRIEVNGELDELYETIIKMVKCLNKGGRICIISFHSLEDRIVKNAFKELETDCICPKDFPICVCGKHKEINILTKKPIVALEDEIKYNSRAKSAKLRIAERI